MRERFEVTPLIRKRPGFRTKRSSALYVWDRIDRKYVAGPFKNHRSATIARESIRLQVKETGMTDQKRQDQTKERQGSTAGERSGTDTADSKDDSRDGAGQSEANDASDKSNDGDGNSSDK